MKNPIQQEQAETAEVEMKISASSAAFCSKLFVPTAGAGPMNPKIQQEQTELTETEMEFSISSVPSCSKTYAPFV